MKARKTTSMQGSAAQTAHNPSFLVHGVTVVPLPSSFPNVRKRFMASKPGRTGLTAARQTDKRRMPPSYGPAIAPGKKRFRRRWYQ